jgi:uncharacterized protein YegP (UPF0339 family)
MTFFVDTDSQGQYIWRLRASNHEIIAHGESYWNKADCLHAIDLVKSTQGTMVVDMTTAGKTLADLASILYPR